MLALGVHIQHTGYATGHWSHLRKNSLATTEKCPRNYRLLRGITFLEAIKIGSNANVLQKET